MKPKIIPIFVLGILGIAFMLSACTISESTTGNTVSATDDLIKDVTISMYNFGFNQDQVTVKKGDHVRLRVTSTQGMHGLMIPDLGLSTSKLAAGEEQILDFVANQSGAFSYYCNVPCGKGHKSMRGQLVVE